MRQFINRQGDDRGQYNTTNVLSLVVSSPGNGESLGVVQLRQRIKMLDAIEDSGPVIEMDDDLHKSLCELINKFSFGVAHRMLLEVVEDVLSANSVDSEAKAPKTTSAHKAAAKTK